MTDYFRVDNGKVFRMEPGTFLSLTVREAMLGPYIIKADGEKRFAGNEEAYGMAAKRGETMSLVTLFDRWRVLLGLGEEMLSKTLADIRYCWSERTQADLVMNVFPGAVVQEQLKI